MSHDSSGNNCNSNSCIILPSRGLKLNYDYTLYIIGMSNDCSGSNCNSNSCIMSPSSGLKLNYKYTYVS